MIFTKKTPPYKPKPACPAGFLRSAYIFIVCASGIPQLWQKVSFVSFIPKVYQNFWVGKNTPHPFPKKLGKLTFNPPKTAPGSHLARKTAPESRKVKKSSSENMLFFQKYSYF
ncbi:MAG: hypothetical protein PUK73_04285 [Spirochaetota bacterium]|uniref:hypothetical protein n=1 Tax=Candidatus Avelusimicrobium faecicola TaxID=3416205 RepID=UPI002A676337|nr:hypothetical protein [Spirochaetota bacterium]MDY6128549.1 hypothetical protein [Elusimicrobiaceae bacterium]